VGCLMEKLLIGKALHRWLYQSSEGCVKKVRVCTLGIQDPGLPRVSSCDTRMSPKHKAPPTYLVALQRDIAASLRGLRKAPPEESEDIWRITH